MKSPTFFLIPVLAGWVIAAPLPGNPEPVREIVPADPSRREGLAVDLPDHAGTVAPEEPAIRKVEGWTVHLHPLLRGKEETSIALELLQRQLEAIVRVVPAPAVAELRRVQLWFSPAYSNSRPRAEYHPDAEWLRRHGRDPAMAQGVEFSNISIFRQETERMPNFALHELAHAWHHRVLTFEQPEILAAYAAAKASGRYARVAQRHGKGRPETMGRAYALTDAKEYFAEGTEAFFSTNDFYPFYRPELETYDPQLTAVLRRLWGVEPA
jgi:hypothetical protein